MTKTHSMSKTKIYKIFYNMRNRCNNINTKDYKHYGGRGITICKEWNSFLAFYADMGESYKEGLEIDRIDNNKGYSKDNCRWATRKEQINNTRRCHTLTLNGITKNITQWAKEIGINSQALSNRIFEYNWSVEKALTTKKMKNQYV